MHRIVTLGSFALLDPDGRIVESVRGRNLALLALLSRAGEAGLTREKLAAYLWPESDASRARHSLDQALYTVRRALDPDPFVRAASTLALRSEVVGSDVADFAGALERGEPAGAIEHYRGEFLDGFHLSGAGEFERWVDAERAELHRLYTGALEELATGAAVAGEHATAVGYWRRLAAASPLSSRVALELMRALERAGDRAQAIQAADVHAALVREELDAPPDPAVRELAHALRAAGEGPESPGRPERPAMGAEPVASRADLQAAAARPGERQTRGRRRRWAAALLAAAGLAIGWTLAGGEPAGEMATRPQVVVERFANQTGDPALDPFGDLSADWIIEGLARTGLVEVLDGEAATGKATSVVGGRYYRTGDSIRLQARILDPETGEVIRALETLTTDATRPAAALEPLRQHVLGAMGTLYDPRLSAWAGTALRPPSYAAYQAFAAGLEHHAVPRDLPAAVERFRRAVELDGDYLLPQLWLAWSLLMMDDLPRADSAMRALRPHRQRLAPVERAWHDRIAALIAGDNEASYQAARRLVELAPRSGWVIALANAALATNRPAVAVEALLYAGIENVGLEREQAWATLTAAYHRLGEHERELAAAEEAVRSDGLDWGHTGPGIPALAALGRVEALDRRLQQLEGRPPAYRSVPLAPVAHLSAVRELRVHGRTEAAGALGQRLLDRAAPPEDSVQRLLRVELLYELGRWQEASEVLSTVPSPDFRSRALTALIAARQGNVRLAGATERELAALDRPYLFGEPAFWRARIAAVMGRHEVALDLLRQSFREGRGGRGYYELHAVRDFEALRQHPGFRELVEPG